MEPVKQIPAALMIDFISYDDFVKKMLTIHEMRNILFV